MPEALADRPDRDGYRSWALRPQIPLKLHQILLRAALLELRHAGAQFPERRAGLLEIGRAMMQDAVGPQPGRSKIGVPGEIAIRSAERQEAVFLAEGVQA